LRGTNKTHTQPSKSKVKRRQRRGSTKNNKGKNKSISSNRVKHNINRRKRNIKSPTKTNTILKNYKRGSDDPTEPEQEKRKIIKTRIKNLRSRQEKRKKKVTKTRKNNRHNKKEDHNNTMKSNGKIITVAMRIQIWIVEKKDMRWVIRCRNEIS
jgi:hypothetical protein